MKLNNLSRLTALLLALTIFLSSVAFAAPVAEGDYTFADYEAQLAAQTGTCETCVSGLGYLPTTDHKGNTIEITCVYDHVVSLGSASERYAFLNYVDLNMDASYRSTYLQEYNDHMALTDDSGNPIHEELLCNCGKTYVAPSTTDHDPACPWYTDEVIIIPDIPQPPVYGGDPQGNQYTSNEEYNLPMANDRAIILPEGGRAVIHSNVEAADGYQWQVYDGTQWVSIQGETGADLVVTTAKLNTIFELTGVAELRYFDVANDIVKASVSVTSQEIAGGEYVDPVEEAQTLSLIEREADGKVTITINYWLDGKAIYETWTSDYNYGEAVSQAVNHPTVQGYLPYIGENNTTESSTRVDLVFDSLTEDKTYDVYYRPTNVTYTVKHYLQDLDATDENPSYTLQETETLTGLTGSHYSDPTTTALERAKTYPGFYALQYSETEYIGADGLTVVEIYYDRVYFLMKFQLGDGGYGTEPIYDRFGAALTITEPTRAGYTFAGWKLNGTGDTIAHADMPTTMPAENRTYVAQWTAQETEYARAYWVQNKDGTKTYIGSEIVAAQSGSIVSGSDTLTVDTYVCGMAEHTHDDTCEKICTLPDHVHGDGSCVYICGKQEHDHSSGCDCTEAVHTEHTRTCYTFTANVSQNAANVNNNLTHVRDDNGFSIYRRRQGNNNNYYVLINGSYYQINNYQNNTSLAYQLTCHYHTSACCIIEAHEHNANCCDFHVHDAACYSCGAVEHTHVDGCKTDLAKYVQFVDADENVTVEGDGSSIVNVNYEYKTYTIRFIYARQEGNDYDIATLTRDGRLDNCQWTGITTLPTFSDPSGKTERSSVEIDGITYYYISLTAKYGADIADSWPSANIGNTGNYEWGSWAAAAGTGYRVKYGDEHANIVGPYPIMSADMIVDNPTKLDDGTYLAQNMIAWWGNNQGIEYHAYHNYFELLPGEQKEDGQTYLEYGGKTYKLVQTYTFTAAHNGTTRVDPIYFNGYYCVNDTSGTSNDTQANSNYYANDGECAICGDECKYCNNFFYDRNVHKLYFWNHNGYLQEGTGADVVYGDVLTKYGDHVNEEFMAQPENYPEGLEANAYQFAGWYTTAACLDGTEVDWNTTMPDADMTFYAKWEPVTHYVNFYLTKEQMDNYLDGDDTTVGAQYIAEVGVPHDEYTDDVLIANNRAADATSLEMENVKNGDYTFVGWFYLDDDGKEKMFDPFDMQVKKDLNLYGKWSSKVLKTYTVRYGVKNADDSWTYIADESTGSALAGMTKTVYPKDADSLYPNYQEHYFPLVQKHTITLDIDGNEVNELNVYTFEYVYVEHVPYKVHYVTKTEPDSHLGTIVIDGETCYILHETKLVPNNVKAAVTEKYEPVAGYLPDEYQKGLTLVANGTDPDGDGYSDENVIVFYYEKNENSGIYTITHYIEHPNGVEIADGTYWNIYEESGEVGTYGSNYTAEYIDIEYYTKDETVTEKLTSGVLTKENGLALKLFYRENSVTLNYEVVAPDGVQPAEVGTVAINDDTTVPGINASESVKILTGEAKGAEAEAKDNTYKFVGWYDNEACTGTPLSTDPSFIPEQPDDGKWVDGTTYYAKFEYNLTSMTIKKAAGTNTSIETNETFIFTVSGKGLPDGGMKVVIQGTNEVTINGLTVGETYTVVEDTNWSWRYTGVSDHKNGQLTLSTDAKANKITFTNTRTNDQWLSDESSIVNFDGTNQ